MYKRQLYQKRIIVIGNTYYHHSTVDDNYFVPEDYIMQLDELEKHDPDLHRVARKGRFGINGRLVFPQFEVRTEREDVYKRQGWEPEAMTIIFGDWKSL